MYVPKHFEAPEPDLALQLIRDLKFGILVTIEGDAPIATHIPIDLVENEQGERYLFGHISKANMQKSSFSDNAKALVIFSTPDAYISASWYNHINVPTSNYVAVHVYGHLKIIEDENELIRRLTVTVNEREASNNYRYKVEDLPEDYLKRELRGIVGFKISIEEIQPAFKLSQNRNEADFKSIISELKKRGTKNDSEIINYMQKMRPNQDEFLDLKQQNLDLTFKMAVLQEEKTKIYDSRYAITKDQFPFLFTNKDTGHIAKDAFDDHSYLFCSMDKQEVVGSCRFTPKTLGKWEISDSLPEGIELEFNPETTAQLNRVYVEENYRNRALHEFMFYYFSNWVINNTNYTHYFALCNAGLVRMYQRLGAQLMTQDGFLLHGRLAHKYYLVWGAISDFNAIIKNKYSL